MFAILRHAGYHLGDGSLTDHGIQAAQQLAEALARVSSSWREVHASPTPRTQQTAHLIAELLHLQVVTDERTSMDGNFVELLPPTSPDHIIFVSHLPVLTKLLRIWSRAFHIDEPPLTEVASGYLIDPQTKTIQSVKSS